MTDSPIRKALPDFRWERVETLRYKAEGSAPFRDVTRQVLFGGDATRCEWRYFEVAPDGYTTLERHHHAHAVMILRGSGRCLVGERVHAVGERDLVAVPPLAWHQFRAGPRAPLGFLCLVDTERDRPQLPGPDDLAALRRVPEVAAFIRAGDDRGVNGLPDG